MPRTSVISLPNSSHLAGNCLQENFKYQIILQSTTRNGMAMSDSRTYCNRVTRNKKVAFARVLFRIHVLDIRRPTAVSQFPVRKFRRRCQADTCSSGCVLRCEVHTTGGQPISYFTTMHMRVLQFEGVQLQIACCNGYRNVTILCEPM